MTKVQINDKIYDLFFTDLETLSCDLNLSYDLTEQICSYFGKLEVSEYDALRVYQNVSVLAFVLLDRLSNQNQMLKDIISHTVDFLRK